MVTGFPHPRMLRSKGDLATLPFLLLLAWGWESTVSGLARPDGSLGSRWAEATASAAPVSSGVEDHAALHARTRF